jgi:purine catabolism regulator
MTMSLLEILTLEVMRDAEPDILAGGESLDREVRWVHSSEIYEISPLLAGGELLLTTGLGLAQVDETARKHYIRDLAARGVAGVAMEVGRSFGSVPAEMVDEARHRAFPLIALNKVVPFIRVTEVTNSALVDYARRGHRAQDFLGRGLNEALLSGADVHGVLRTASALIQAPLVLVSPTGTIVDSIGDEAGVEHAVREPTADSAVFLHGGAWGRLLAGGGSPLPSSQLARGLEYVATALAVALLRTGSPRAHRDQHTTALLHDLVSDAGIGEADAAARASLSGFQLPQGLQVVGVAVHSEASDTAIRLLDTSAQLLGAAVLRGVVTDGALALQVVPATHTDAVGALERAIGEARSRGEFHGVVAAVGPAFSCDDGYAAAGRSLRDARATLQLAERMLPVSPSASDAVVSSRRFALELHLSRTMEELQLRALVGEVLGPLLQWDSDRGTELVHTLEAYLRNGASPTRTASQLYVRRQTLYQRLERIESLLGHSVSDPYLLSSLLLATSAWRLIPGG